MYEEVEELVVTGETDELEGNDTETETNVAHTNSAHPMSAHAKCLLAVPSLILLRNRGCYQHRRREGKEESV